MNCWPGDVGVGAGMEARADVGWVSKGRALCALQAEASLGWPGPEQEQA